LQFSWLVGNYESVNMPRPSMPARSITHRFAVAAAIMTALAVLLTAGLSLWTVNQERSAANKAIARDQARFQTERLN
jgi:hypothetical protein